MNSEPESDRLKFDASSRSRLHKLLLQFDLPHKNSEENFLVELNVDKPQFRGAFGLNIGSSNDSDRNLIILPDKGVVAVAPEKLIGVPREKIEETIRDFEAFSTSLMTSVDNTNAPRVWRKNALEQIRNFEKGFTVL